MDTEATWNEERARAWLAAEPWSPWAMLVKQSGVIRSARVAPAEWYEARPLPESYRGLTSHEGECLPDARRMRKRFPELRLAVGYSFRAKRPEAGIAHCFNVDPEGLSVDLASTRFGPAEGLLGIFLPENILAHLRYADSPGPMEAVRELGSRLLL